MQYLCLMQGLLILTHWSCTELHVEIWVVTSSTHLSFETTSQRAFWIISSYPCGMDIKIMKMFLECTRDNISITERQILLSLHRVVRNPLWGILHTFGPSHSGKINDHKSCNTDQKNEEPTLVEGSKRAGFCSSGKWKLRKNKVRLFSLNRSSIKDERTIA